MGFPTKFPIESIAPLVLAETNVKAIKLVTNEDGVFVKRVKPDFKKLGKKLGKMMKQVAEMLKELDNKAIAEFEREGQLTLDVDGTSAVIELDDVEIYSEDIPGWLVANEGSVTIALDVTVTPELRREGIAREIVNRIQNIRKERDYNITDRIKLTFDSQIETNDAIAEYKEYISSQVLATELVVGQVDSEDKDAVTLDIDELNLNVKIVLA